MEECGGVANDENNPARSNNPVNDSPPRITTRRRKRSLDGKASFAMQRIIPIMPVLEALVDLELTQLDHDDDDENYHIAVEAAADPHSVRRVHFAAFDGSTLMPPSDVTEGSYKPQAKCIEKLTNVLDAIRALDWASTTTSNSTKILSSDTTTTSPAAAVTEGATTKSDVFSILLDIVAYLDEDFRMYYHDAACALSIISPGPGSSTGTTKSSSSSSSSSTTSLRRVLYPSSRIEKAAAVYSRDLESLIAHRSSLLTGLPSSVAVADAVPSLSFFTVSDWGDHPDNSNVTQRDLFTPDKHPLAWECRLADVAAQLVRYWLRTLLNPVPVRATQRDKSKSWNTRIIEMVNITMKDKSVSDDANNNNNNSDDESSSSFVVYDDDVQAAICSAVDDGSLSSLLSDSLSHLYDYLRNGAADSRINVPSQGHWKKYMKKVVPTKFCDSDLCKMGIGNNTQRKQHSCHSFTESEWNQIHEEIQHASDFLAFYHRLVFLEQLLTIVVNTIQQQQWIGTVFSAAHHLLRLDDSYLFYVSYDSTKSLHAATPFSRSQNLIVQPEDAHLALLGMPLSELLDCIRKEVVPLASSRHVECRRNLHRTILAFRLDGNSDNNKFKKKYQPFIGMLEDHWKQVLKPGLAFPTVTLK
jgi:hypothetical protein